MPNVASKSMLGALVCAAVLAAACPARAEFNNPKANKPPRAKPNRRSAGEGIPPLPLTASGRRLTRSRRRRSTSSG